MWGVSKYSYQSALCWLCSSFFCVRCQQIYVLWSSRSENPGVYAAELRPRAKPGYVHSLGCDPVKFSQDLGRANLTLASTQNRRLFASKPTSKNPKLVIALEMFICTRYHHNSGKCFFKSIKWRQKIIFFFISLVQRSEWLFLIFKT